MLLPSFLVVVNGAFHVLAAFILLSAGFSLQAQPYPNRAVKIIVPQPPGGGFDSVGRALADRFSKLNNQSFVVENRSGSGTLLGTDAAAKALPDGYTLLVGSVSNLALNMGLYANLPYDSLRDFETLGLAVSYSYTLMARKDLPFKSLAEVIEHAKANPGKLTYASAGNGSGQHVLAAALWHTVGVSLVHVPYKGAQAAYQDMLGGRVDLFFDLSPTAKVQVDAGAVKPLAVSGATRNTNLPDVPTLLESKVPLELESWFGLFAPSKTPADVLAKLRADFSIVTAQKDLAEQFTKTGGKALTLSATEARTLVQRDVDKWAKMVKTIGIKPD